MLVPQELFRGDADFDATLLKPAHMERDVDANEQYTWRDAGDHVEVHIKCKGIPKSSVVVELMRQRVKVAYGTNSDNLEVTVDGKVVFLAELHAQIQEAASSSKLLPDGVLLVSMVKRVHEEWPRLATSGITASGCVCCVACPHSAAT